MIFEAGVKSLIITFFNNFTTTFSTNFTIIILHFWFCNLYNLWLLASGHFIVQLNLVSNHSHNSMLEWLVSLSFNLQTKQTISSIWKFQFSKFQDSWQLEILSKISLFELDSEVLLLVLIEFFNFNSSKKDFNKTIFKCHQILLCLGLLQNNWRVTKFTLSSSNNILYSQSPTS